MLPFGKRMSKCILHMAAKTPPRLTKPRRLGPQTNDTIEEKDLDNEGLIIDNGKNVEIRVELTVTQIAPHNKSNYFIQSPSLSSNSINLVCSNKHMLGIKKGDSKNNNIGAKDDVSNKRKTPAVVAADVSRRFSENHD